MDVKNILNKKDGFLCTGAVTEKMLHDAEKSLGLEFNEEYKEYVKVFGACTYVGHEISGVCKDTSYNVVCLTQDERSINSNIPKSFYVIEQIHIDGIVIWQSKDGAIYKTIGQSEPMKIYDSFAEYVELV